MIRVISLVLMLSAGMALAGETSVSLTASVSAPIVTDGESFSAEILLRWDGDQDRQFEPPVLSGTKNCSIIGVTVENRLGETNGRRYSVRRYAYTLKPEGPGMAWFGTTAVRYREGSREKFLVSPDLTTEVQPRKPSRRKYSFLFFLAILVVSAGVSLVAVLLYWKRPTWKARSAAQTQVPAEVSPEEKLFTQFIGLNRSKERQTASELFAGYLRILRELLSLRAGSEARVLPDRDLLAKAGDEKTSGLLSAVFESAAAIRYAGRAAGPEDVEMLKDALARLFDKDRKESPHG